MAVFDVQVYRSQYASVQVEAEDEQQAREQVGSMSPNELDWSESDDFSVLDVEEQEVQS